MKIIVLNGSPKGPLSATLQYARFIEKHLPEHDYQIVHFCQQYEKLQQDQAAFDRLMDDVRRADGVLWTYPITTLLVHADFKRFIELILARGAQDAFRGKYAALLTTSLHFFDFTSHNYMHAICDDFGMKFVDSFSAFTYDLLEEEERQRLILFARCFFGDIENRIPTVAVYDPVQYYDFDYVPSSTPGNVDLGGKRMVILTDSEDAGDNVAKMVRRLQTSFAGSVEVINLHQEGPRLSCDGCFQCGADGVCAREDADALHDLYLSRLSPADVLVMAGTIRDRYLSPKWKIFFDRGFFRPVTPWWPGKQLAFLVAGPLKQLPNLRQIFEGYVDFHQGSLVGIVTDESQDAPTIDRLLESLAARLALRARQGYVRPRTGLGVGATKIFRDGLFGFLRPVFQVAHRYFRKHGLYDFPQYDLRTRVMGVTGLLVTNLPGVRKRFFRSVKAGMVKCLKKQVDK